MREEQIKQRILEKLAKRIEELRPHPQAFCPGLNPDVIVISGDRTMHFEPQNPRVIEWLRRHFGIANLEIRERIQVHPARGRVISRALKAAGFEVAGEMQSGKTAVE